VPKLRQNVSKVNEILYRSCRLINVPQCNSFLTYWLDINQYDIILINRACERSVSGAENGAERERSGKRSGAGRKSGGAERSVERAESTAHSPLQPIISLY